MFRTELSIAPVTDQLSRTARLLTVGSCFADSIGSRLAANKVETLANPFGTVFQPLALARLLRAAAGEEVDWQQHLVEARGRWQSYDLHGSIGADSPVELLQTIQELVQRTGKFLRSADVVLLTLGTAWAYRLRETGELVSNCHKQSADLFVKELLTPDEIINALAETHAYLRRINPELRFVLTVSPVRHLKDTLPLNSVSKSVLRVATHIVSDLLPDVAYFPAYELLMDDLRDYRFYAADMLHPSEVAEDYVWEKFTRTYFDADFGRFRKEWATVRQSLEHRPLHAGAPEHRQFLESTRQKLEQFSLRKVDVGAELKQVSAQLAALPLPKKPDAAVLLEDDEERIDIGSSEAPTAPAVTMPPQALPISTEGRPPRLSPEEFRAQRAARPERTERGRRDGRGKGQPVLPSENEQFQATAADNQLSESSFVKLEALAPAQPEQFEQVSPLTSPDLADATGEEIEKKKKRRSRGGAKRTARKNALRLAAGDVATPSDAANGSETTSETADLGTGTEDFASEPINKKSTVITKSVPVKRGGRRNEPGRVPRVPLFAPDTATTISEATTTVDTAMPALPTQQSPDAVTALPTPTDASETDTTAPNSRNNRNRGKKGGGRAKEDSAEANRSAPVLGATTMAPGQVEGQQLPLGGADASNASENRDTRGQQVSGALPSPAPLVTTDAVAAQAMPGAAARAPRRSKARAVSAARAEKPAVDTPIIPASDANQRARTQVAAGRLTGSAASLVVPAVVPKPAVVTKQVVVAAKAVPKQRKAAGKTMEAVVPLPTAAMAPEPAPAAKPAPTAKRKDVIVKPLAEKIGLKNALKTQTGPVAKPGQTAAKPAKPTVKTKATAAAKSVEGLKPLIAEPIKASESVISEAINTIRTKTEKTDTSAAKGPPAKAKATKANPVQQPKPKANQKQAVKPTEESTPKPAPDPVTQKPKPRKKPIKPA